MQVPPTPPAPAHNPASLFQRLSRLVGWVVTALVWAAWAGSLALALWMVVHYGSPVPMRDDWWFVPVLTGARPYTFDWLMERFLDHRLLLTRILVISQLYTAAGDFRVCKFFNVLAMGALAAGMVLTARRLRGKQHLTDIFFPISLLGLTQYDPFLQAMPLGHILTTVLAGTLLLLIVRNPGVWRRRDLVLGGVAFVGLAIGCASGLPYVPTLAVFLGLVVLLRARVSSRHDRWLLIFPLAAAGYVAWYFVGFTRPDFQFPEAETHIKVETTLSFLGMGFGMSIHEWLPWPGVAVAALLLFGGLGLIWVMYSEPTKRVRALGLLCYIGALAAVALAIGWGRSNYLLYAYVSHYVTVALPAVCCAYFLAAVIHPWAGRVVQAALACFVVWIWWPNVLTGLTSAEEYRKYSRPLEIALRARMSPDQAADELRLEPFEHEPEKMADYLRMLRGARIGLFAAMPDESEHEEAPVALEEATVVDLNWEGQSGQVLGPEPNLVFYLPKRRHICAVRVRFSYQGEFDSMASLTGSWGRLEEFPEGLKQRRYEFEPGERERLAFWIDEEIDFFVLSPDPRVRELGVSAVTWLVPKRERAKRSGGP